MKSHDVHLVAPLELRPVQTLVPTERELRANGSKPLAPARQAYMNKSAAALKKLEDLQQLAEGNAAGAPASPAAVPAAAALSAAAACCSFKRGSGRPLLARSRWHHGPIRQRTPCTHRR